MIRPLDSPLFQITDDDNQFLFRASLDLVNQQPPNVIDQLLATSTDRFDVTGNGSRVLTIQAIGPFATITSQDEFVSMLRTVSFTTDDQAMFITRNLSLVVEEFPLGEAPSNPFFIPINIIGVNDRPVYNRSSSAVSSVLLDDYIPQDTNNAGFNASYLVSDSEVVDVDRRSPESTDFTGLAIVYTLAPDYLGSWQYYSDGMWQIIPAHLSDCSPLLLDPSQRIRFSPLANFDKLDGNASLSFRVWDGSSEAIYCDNNTFVILSGMLYYRIYSLV